MARGSGHSSRADFHAVVADGRPTRQAAVSRSRIAVEMRFADYVNNVDAALNAILQAGRPPGPPMKQPPP
jgi:hypothetical protein